MDRFVWFVLLVVTTHLVTEFTRVSGYARGQRHELVLLNDVSTQKPAWAPVKKFTDRLAHCINICDIHQNCLVFHIEKD